MPRLREKVAEIIFQRRGGNWLFPDICPACLTRAFSPGSGLCEICLAKLQELPGPRCPACGGAIDGVLDVCGECLAGKNRPWTKAVTVYHYDGFIRELIHRLKYGRAVYLVPFLAEKMAGSWQKFGQEKPDVVTFVPMYWTRKIWRGYNQAELLAQKIAQHLDSPVHKVVRRKKNSRKQVSLNKKGRAKNLTDAFAPVRRHSAKDKHILVIDDVFTTGSTLNATTDAVLKHEPSQVSVLTLARG